MTETVKKQILVIRAMGATNMFDVNTVRHIARRMGFMELTKYLQDHKGEYTRFILTGET